MADAAIGFLTEAVLSKAISLAADELSLSFGVKKELAKLADKLEMIQALLSDAQSKQHTSEVIKLWLKRLKSIALDAQIVLDDFGYQVLCQKIKPYKRDKVHRFFSCSNPVCFRPKMGHKIRDVLSSLESVYAESNRLGLTAVGLINSLPNLSNTSRLTDPFVEDSEIVGREDDAAEVIRMLIGTDHERALPVITILGMGGQGKTALAQLVYNNEKVESYFDIRVWVCVSDDFTVERLLAKIWERITETTSQLSGREALVNRLKEKLGNKRYLLVLDDVWNDNRDECDALRRCLVAIGGSKGSKVMATTRSEEVALALRTSGYHRLHILSEEASFALFEKCAFVEGGANKTPELEAIAKRVLKRCGGVPLAIKAIGGVLYSNNSESEWSMIERSELWSSLPSTGGSAVLSAIRLSYDHLPLLSLKQCFAYCAIFPKDAILEKDRLVQLWMAQGFLNPPKESHLQVEDVGNVYFNILLKSSLFQDARKDMYNNITYCKMHDLVHDFSLQVSEGHCIDIKDWNAGRNETEAMHLSVINYAGGIWKSLKGTVASKLRTLHLEYNDGVKLEDWFVNFRYLTVLTIRIPGENEFTKAISQITHLRFLDISRTWIHRPPKSLGELYNLYYLQTLRLGFLDELPVGLGSLINLRHLYAGRFFSAILLPGLGQLTNLQTLPCFKVDKSIGCQIEELEHLDNLRGELRLFGLENVGSYESALRSNMSKKSNIHTLELHWSERRHDCDDTDVMEGLKPHSNLKGLTVVGYQSPKFPSWMITGNGSIQLCNLVRFTLKGLDKCQRLPSLGDLPFLEDLEIDGLRSVESIGKEFYGWSNLDGVRRNSSSSNGAGATLFPALRRLVLRGMDNLKEWSDAIPPTHPTAKAFPSLEEMGIHGCLKLSVFPNLGNLPRLQSVSLQNCENMTLPSSWSSLMCSIDSSIDVESNLPSLHDLYITNCNKFVASLCSLKILTALKSLFINNNPIFWPKDLHHLIHLELLQLKPFRSNETDYFPWPYPHSQVFVSLTSLRLYAWPKITALPDQVQYVTTLRNLELWDFNSLEALPEWLCNLKCLEDLQIYYCKNLKQFPSTEAFQRLTNLQNLVVSQCPLLQERCAKGIGSEWPKIAHIPNINT